MLMDEVAGWVINRKLQTTGVTMQLNVKYKKPVMTTDSQITVRGHIASQRRNIVTIHLPLENSKGEVCDEGEKPSISLSDQTKPEKWASKVARLKGSNSLLFADTTTPLLRAFCGIEISTIKISFYIMLLK